MKRPRPAVLLLVASSTMLATSMTVIAAAGSSSSVASVGERPQDMPATSLPARVQSEGVPFKSLDRQEGGANTRVRRADRFRVDATRLPTRDLSKAPVAVRIPRIDVTAPVDRVGVTSDGKVEVPDDVTRAGWYEHSQLAGTESGSTVLVAHRDGVDQGAGAFYALGKLTPGDVVTLTLASGKELDYEVVAREAFNKRKAPVAELFSSGGPARLTLITCGGPFDSSALSYTENIVVTALPLDRGGRA